MPTRRQPVPILPAAFVTALVTALEQTGRAFTITVQVAPRPTRHVYRLKLGVLTLHRAFADVRDTDATTLADALVRELFAPRRPAIFERLQPAAPPATLRYVQGWSERTGTPVVRERRCVGTPAQQAALRAAYAHFNATRFAGRLPSDLPLRWLAPSRKRLGVCGMMTNAEGTRTSTGIGLDWRLVAPDASTHLTDTLLHEMAHVAAWVVDAHAGHGSAWQRWARQVGATATSCVRGLRLAPPDRDTLRRAVSTFSDDRAPQIGGDGRRVIAA